MIYTISHVIRLYKQLNCLLASIQKYTLKVNVVKSCVMTKG